MPATVISSTRVSCKAPPSYVLWETHVEITLNNQQFTDDNNLYYYYKPPYVFDLEPWQGPTTGGTNVVFVGTNFKENQLVQCKFGDQISPGKYISSHNI